MEDGLGAVAPPTHARAIQAHADEVAHSAFDHATGDWQILATEFLVAYPSGVVGEVVDDLFENLAAVLVARAGDGCFVERRAQLCNDRLNLAGLELLLLLRDPRF